MKNPFYGFVDNTVFRVIGNPIEFREKPTDPKAMYFSKIVNDSNTRHISVWWKTIEVDGKWVEDPDYFFTRN